MYSNLFMLGVFYFSVCLPLVRTNFICKLFPNTSSFELAAAIITVLHTWIATAIGFNSIFTCVVESDYQKAVVYGGSISFTYYLFDTMYLIGRHGFAVLRNKYLGHHIVAICITYAALNNTMESYAHSIMLWYTFIEASNVFLKAWELTKHNIPDLHKLIIRPFMFTYILGRGAAAMVITPMIFNDMFIDRQLSRYEYYVLSLVVAVDAMSVWFGYRILRSLMR
jgi:hypothetical protein